MKTIKILLIAAAAIGLVGCSNENNRSVVPNVGNVNKNAESFAKDLPPNTETKSYGYIALLEQTTSDNRVLLIRDLGSLDLASATREDVLSQSKGNKEAAWYVLEKDAIALLKVGMAVEITSENMQLDMNPPVRYGSAVKILD
ncbi:hypothetical protein ACFFSY_10425 [Paenibacillus aurantiacus]|uniref:DUF3221 domain-containing protein n=1 Tax=Paenibacillus aurantiacus TaxID=1936118 RepID=A0ABV5KMD5_9BACL